MNKRPRILLVDDERSNIKTLTCALKNDYDIFTAMNGYDAISRLKEHHPDLILLDVMMPDMDGFEVCKIIKSDEAFSDIPVIFLTALDTFGGEFQGLELGGIDYLSKPINFYLLGMRIRNHIALKERNVQNPGYTGHPIRFELDTESGSNWTLNPVLTGQ